MLGVPALDLLPHRPVPNVIRTLTSAADAVYLVYSSAGLDSGILPSMYLTPGGKYVLLASISAVTAGLRPFYAAPQFRTFVPALLSVIGSRQLAVQRDLLDVPAADWPKIAILGQLHLSRYQIVRQSKLPSACAVDTIQQHIQR